MKNFKKVVALVLALAMVLSMGTVAFAATDNAAEADVLYDLGLLEGYSSTEKVLGLTDPANAYQAMKLIGVALMWDVNADAEVAFTDVPDYAVPYVAYAVANGITNGISATEFGSEVDGKRMATWTLRALGYGLAESWNDTDTLAAAAGITVPAGDVTRDAVVGVIYDTLSATPVGDSTTVIDQLVAADETLRATAETAGLVEPLAADFAVAEVAAWGLKGFMITFTSDIDGDVTIAGVTTDAVEEDGNVVYVTLDAAVAQNTDVTFDLSATGVDGIEIDEVEYTVTIADRVDPTVESVVATNAKTIKVTYSEPVDPASLELGTKVFADVKIDGAKFVGSAALSADGTVVTYTSNSKLAANTYVFTTEAATDFAGFVAPAVAKSITVVADDAAPVLVSVEATNTTTVKLTFDEDVKAIDEVVIDGVTIPTANISISGAVVTVTLTVALEPADAFIAVTGTYSAVSDVLDNESGDDIAIIPFKAIFDDAAPTATVVVTDTNTIEVTFTEEVDAFLAADYTLEDADENVIASTVAAGDDDNEFVITLADADVNASTLTLTILDTVKDKSVIANAFVEKAFTVALNDLKAPTVETTAVLVDATDDIIRVTFDEAMDIATLTKASNYLYAADGTNYTSLAVVDDVEFTVAADGKSVDITIPDVTAASTLRVLAAADVAGNVVSNSAAVVAVDAPVAFEVDTITQTGAKTLEVVANHDFTVIDPNEFEIFVSGGAKSSTHYVISAVIDADDATKAVLTLNDSLKPDGTTDNATAYVVKVTGVDTVDNFGSVIEDVAAEAIVDGASATITAAGGTGEITLTLDEATNTVATTAALDIIVRDEDGAPVAVATTDVSIATTAGVSVITIDNLAAGDYSVEVFSRYIQDGAGNLVNALAATDVTVE